MWISVLPQNVSSSNTISFEIHFYLDYIDKNNSKYPRTETDLNSLTDYKYKRVIFSCLRDCFSSRYKKVNSDKPDLRVCT